MRSFIAFLLVISVCLITQHAGSTTLFYKDFRSLVKEADGIVEGTVEGIESHYDSLNDIYTFITLGNINVLQGNYTGDELIIRQKGGEIEGDVLEIEGSPQFELGQHVVVFVKGNGKEIVPFVGWTQGVFNVVTTKNGRVITDYEGNRVLGVKKGKFMKQGNNVSESTLIDSTTGAIISKEQYRYQSDGQEAVVSELKSQEGSASLGQPDDAGTIQKGENNITGSDIVRPKESANPLTLEGFRDAIVREAKAAKRKKAILESMDAEDLNISPEIQDGTAKGSKKEIMQSDSHREDVKPTLPKRLIEPQSTDKQ